MLKKDFMLRIDQANHFCNSKVLQFLRKREGRDSLSVAFASWINSTCEVQKRLILKMVMNLTADLRLINNKWKDQINEMTKANNSHRMPARGDCAVNALVLGVKRTQGSDL